MKKKKGPFEVLDIDWKLKQSTLAPSLITEAKELGSLECIFYTCTKSSLGTFWLTDLESFHNISALCP